MKQYNVPFHKLPITYKKALLELHYMECETLEDVQKLYHDTLFTIEILSIQESTKRCMERMPEWSGYQGKTFEEYHADYVGDGSHIPNHGDSMYPVIENLDMEDEWLSDGWHRFHSYVKNKKEHVPLLRFQEGRI